MRETVEKEIMIKRKEATRVYELIIDLVDESGFTKEMITSFCESLIKFNDLRIAEMEMEEKKS